MKFICVQVFFCHFPSRLLCGEICQITIELVNTGQRPMHNLKVASTNPEFFTFGSLHQPSVKQDQQQTWPEYFPIIPDSDSDKSVNRNVVPGQTVTCVCKLPLERATIEPGETVQLTAWIRGPDVPGEHSIDFLFYYEPTEKLPQFK